MKDDEKKTAGEGVSRRTLLSAVPLAVAGSAAFAGASEAQERRGPRRGRRGGRSEGPLNILFIFTDQERYFHHAESVRR